MTVKQLKTQKNRQKIMREVLKNVDLNRFPFDEFWFWEGYTRANEEIEEKRKIARRCLDFQNVRCNHNCLNEYCPLNDNKEVKNAKRRNNLY
jgi:hypothetical protein